MSRGLVSAYVPCHNNAPTIRRAVESVLGQTARPSEVLVIDDGSTDGSTETLKGLDVRLVRLERNLGRGAARARAMAESHHEFVLCCDATNVLDPAFADRALAWFDDQRVAAVFGRITQLPARTVAERWRGRHLFKLATEPKVRRDALLSTYGAIVRASAVREVGGYDASLRHNEDGDLGKRLFGRGYGIVYDPTITACCAASNTCAQVLERYWRWYAGKDEAVTWRGYWRNFVYASKGMTAADLRAGDPLAAVLSLITPHYQFWKSWISRRACRQGHQDRASQ